MEETLFAALGLVLYTGAVVLGLLVGYFSPWKNGYWLNRSKNK